MNDSPPHLAYTNPSVYDTQQRHTSFYPDDIPHSGYQCHGARGAYRCRVAKNNIKEQIREKQVANDLLLTIRDNGKGFDCTKAQNGNGLKNMKARALEINALLNFEAKEGQGTTLKLSLPLT